MYCKVCGNPLKESDTICTVCGTRLDVKSEWEDKGKNLKQEADYSVPLDTMLDDEEPLSEAPRKIYPFDWVEGKEEKAEKQAEFFESLSSDQSADEETIHPTRADGEFSWNVYDFPKPKKTEEIEFDWGDSDLSEFPKIELPDVLIPEMMTDMILDEIPEGKSEIPEVRNDLSEEIDAQKEAGMTLDDTDQYFTFDEKNEEFQKLLDREYERLKEQELPMQDGPSLHERMELWTAPQEIPKLDAENVQEIAAEFHEQAKRADVAPIPVYIAGLGPETLASLRELNDRDTIEMKPLRSEPAATMPEPPVVVTPEPAIITPEPAVVVIPDPPVVIPEPPIIKPEPPPAVVPAPVGIVAEAKEIAKPLQKEPSIPEEAERVAASFFKEEVRGFAREQEEKEREPLWFDEEIEEETEEDETSGRRFGLGRVILVIVLVLLALEIVTLGIKFMAPKSAAAEAITKFQVGMVDTLSDFGDQIVGLFDRSDKKTEEDTTAEEEKTPVEEPEEPEQSEVEQKPVVVDTTPAEDKAVLIEEAKESNRNISSVTANPDLAYVSGKDYGSSAINNSVPLTENVWSEDAKGNAVLFDQEIVRTLIAFDSAWIDYVNGGSDSVIDLTKKGSRAYLSASNYSKVGKINETFDALEIGEIRKGGDGYYAWVFEKITKTEGGKTSTASYHWIYYLEPIGNEMKIVDYIKY